MSLTHVSGTIFNKRYMNYYLAVLKKYAVFSGRATRSEYWYFQLFNTIVYIILMVLDGLISINNFGFLTIIYMLAMIIPSIAVTVRRLHDTGKSGWMILISFVPFIGGIWLFVLTVLDSTADNKYGPNLKGNVGTPPAAVPPAPPAPPVQ